MPELIKRSKELHGLDEACRVKIGGDHGQGYLKITAQNLNIATNIIKFTLVLAVAPVNETIRNLYTLFEKLNLKTFPKDDDYGIAVDCKVLQMLYGQTGGKASFPCTICLWEKSSGFIALPQEPRTLKHCEEMHAKLLADFNGNRNKSKFCYSIEAETIIKEEPYKVIKIPSLHLHLLVNDAYKKLKKKVSLEQRAVLEEQRKRAGVIESCYEGGTLQGNHAKKFVQAVATNKIEVPIPELRELFLAMDNLRHTCFGLERKEGAEEAVEDFVHCWEQAGMGVGVKAHMVQHHLIPNMLALPKPEALGVWSEQATESSHHAFKRVMEKYMGIKNGLLNGTIAFNSVRM